MRNIIVGILGIIIVIWGYNQIKLNQLQERYDNALQEHEMLLEIDSLNQIKIDSLENIYHELIDTVQYESVDTTVINWPWGREEFYYFKYKEQI